MNSEALKVEFIEYYEKKVSFRFGKLDIMSRPPRHCVVMFNIHFYFFWQCCEPSIMTLPFEIRSFFIIHVENVAVEIAMMIITEYGSMLLGFFLLTFEGKTWLIDLWRELNSPRPFHWWFAITFFCCFALPLSMCVRSVSDGSAEEFFTSDEFDTRLHLVICIMIFSVCGDV